MARENKEKGFFKRIKGTFSGGNIGKRTTEELSPYNRFLQDLNEQFIPHLKKSLKPLANNKSRLYKAIKELPNDAPSEAETELKKTLQQSLNLRIFETEPFKSIQYFQDNPDKQDELEKAIIRNIYTKIKSPIKRGDAIDLDIFIQNLTGNGFIASLQLESINKLFISAIGYLSCPDFSQTKEEAFDFEVTVKNFKHNLTLNNCKIEDEICKNFISHLVGQGHSRLLRKNNLSQFTQKLSNLPSFIECISNKITVEQLLNADEVDEFIRKETIKADRSSDFAERCIKVNLANSINKVIKSDEKAKQLAIYIGTNYALVAGQDDDDLISRLNQLKPFTDYASDHISLKEMFEAREITDFFDEELEKRITELQNFLDSDYGLILKNSSTEFKPKQELAKEYIEVVLYKNRHHSPVDMIPSSSNPPQASDRLTKTLRIRQNHSSGFSNLTILHQQRHQAAAGTSSQLTKGKTSTNSELPEGLQPRKNSSPSKNTPATSSTDSPPKPKKSLSIDTNSLPRTSSDELIQLPTRNRSADHLRASQTEHTIRAGDVATMTPRLQGNEIIGSKQFSVANFTPMPAGRGRGRSMRIGIGRHFSSQAKEGDKIIHNIKTGQTAIYDMPSADSDRKGDGKYPSPLGRTESDMEETRNQPNRTTASPVNKISGKESGGETPSLFLNKSKIVRTFSGKNTSGREQDTPKGHANSHVNRQVSRTNSTACERGGSSSN